MEISDADDATSGADGGAPASHARPAEPSAQLLRHPGECEASCRRSTHAACPM